MNMRLTRILADAGIDPRGFVDAIIGGDFVMDNLTDNYEAINNAIVNTNATFGRGACRLTGTFYFNTESKFEGAGDNFQGTRIIPRSDVPLFTKDPAQSLHTRMLFKDFMVEADLITSNPVFDMNECYFMTFDHVWIRNFYQAVKIVSCDSISFYALKCVETGSDYAVILGDDCTNINFFACNFEENSTDTDKASYVKIDGNLRQVSVGSFFGCQLERSGIDVFSGSIKWLGGKIGASSTVSLLTKATECTFDTAWHPGTTCHDFGYNTVVKNAYCQNMSVPEHKWPVPQSSTNAATFGAAGEEWLFLTSVKVSNNTAVTGQTFDIKEGATVLATSPSFDLFAVGSSIGLPQRPHYTWVTCTKSSAAAMGPVSTAPVVIAGVRGGKCLNTNATFAGGASTGWTLNNSTTSAVGDDCLVTPGGATWGIYQTLTSLCKFGKKYIAVAKFSGTATLCLGNAWDGTAGARGLYTTGVADLYGDGDTVAMISFEFNQQQTQQLSLGHNSSSSAVTVKWFALIEA